MRIRLSQQRYSVKCGPVTGAGLCGPIPGSPGAHPSDRGGLRARSAQPAGGAGGGCDDGRRSQSSASVITTCAVILILGQPMMTGRMNMEPPLFYVHDVSFPSQCTTTPKTQNEQLRRP
ncbi:MAG: hypothetical protein OXC53_03765, partial [Rhodobacteraceae bacterium]|nr:hypothetical protein [Paracoccaceae bacterium]